MTAYEREKFWEKQIELFKTSGQKDTEWCRSNGIGLRTLNKWMKRLSDTDGINTSSNNRFIIAKAITEQQTGSIISIKIGKATISLDSEFDVDALTKVIQIISRVC